MQRMSLAEVRTITYKQRDSWWTVLLVDPYASRLVRMVYRYRWVTPNRLTLLATLLGFGSAACFAMADRAWLLAGAALFHLSFVVDCMDGKVSRLQGSGTVFGAWLDYVFDRIRVLVCAIALMGGQYAETHRLIYLYLGFAVVALDLFHYLDLLEMSKVKSAMRGQINAALREYAEAVGPGPQADDTEAAIANAERSEAEAGAGHPLAASAAITPEALTPAALTPAALTPAALTPAAVAPGAPAAGGTEGQARPAPAEGLSVHDVSSDFRSRFRGYMSVRNFLAGNRIRPKVITGIELHMFVFIVAPVAGGIIPITLTMGTLLLLFEVAVIYKLWLSTKAFSRQLAKVERDTARVLAARPAETAETAEQPAQAAAGRTLAASGA